MAKQPEGRLVRRILKRLRRRFGGKWWKIHGNEYQESGIPDIFGICQGMFFGIEVKMPGKQPRENQLDQLAQITASGGLGIWVTTVGQAERNVGLFCKPIGPTANTSRTSGNREKDRRTVRRTGNGKNVDNPRSDRGTRRTETRLLWDHSVPEKQQRNHMA